MERLDISRRKFGIGVAAVTAVSLAGCSGGDDQPDPDDRARAELQLIFENEDGEPVSNDFAVELDPEFDGNTISFTHLDVVGGSHSLSLEWGEYTATVSSDPDELISFNPANPDLGLVQDFDTVTEDIDVPEPEDDDHDDGYGDDDDDEEDEPDVSETIILDGAISDDEFEAMGEDE